MTVTKPSLKICIGCGKSLWRDAFYASGGARCKSCIRLRSRDRARRLMANPTARAEQNEKRRDYRFRYGLRHQDRVDARHDLQHEVEAGRLVRPKKCQWCGTEGLIEGHHEDYKRPLDVIWLCQPCHGLTRIGAKRDHSTVTRPSPVSRETPTLGSEESEV